MNGNEQYCDGTTASDTPDWKRKLSEIFRSAWTQTSGRKAIREVVLKYLTSTKEGRELLAERIHVLTPKQSFITHVLVLMHPDGWVEVYSSKDVKPQFATMSPFAGSAALRLKSEELLESQLPPYLKDVYNPTATDTSPGLIASNQVQLKQQHGHATFTWRQCCNPWPVRE